MLITDTPKSLSQVGFACTRSPDQDGAFIEINGRQHGEAAQALRISAGNPAGIKVVKDPGGLQREVISAEQKI